jgi:hypothetical protein
MYWSQDVVISVLFPYLLPSLPVCKSFGGHKDTVALLLEHNADVHADR